MRGVKFLLLIFLLYLFAHSPLVPTFGVLGRMSHQFGIYILYIIAIFHYLWKPQKYSYYFRKVKTEFTIFLFIVLYVFLRTLAEGDGEVLTIHIKALLELFLIPFYFIIYCNSIKVNEERDFIRLFLYLGCVGAVITTACVMSPSFNDYVRDRFLHLTERDFLFDIDFRGFGISTGLTYEYGIIQGVIIALGLSYIRDNKWFLFFIPLMVLSIMLNARTGMVVAFSGLIIFMVDKKIHVGTIFIVAIFLLVFYSNMEYYMSNLGLNRGSEDFIESFAEEIEKVSSTGDFKDTTLGALFRMMILPDNFVDWIIGRGYYAFGVQGAKNTDVGFALQLNYGGLLYVIPLYYLIIRFTKKLFKLGLVKLAVLFIMTFFIANFKGPYLPESGMFRLLVLISIYYFTKPREVKI